MPKISLIFSTAALILAGSIIPFILWRIVGLGFQTWYVWCETNLVVCCALSRNWIMFVYKVHLGACSHDDLVRLLLLVVESTNQ